MKHQKLALAISTILLSSPSWVAAQSAEDEIEKLVVVSSRIATPMREIGTSVTLVTQADINARGHANLVDVLKSQPAINSTNSGGIGSPTALRVRGEEGYRTLVRIDGVDISDPTGPQVSPELAHLQTANVSRVEILRGSQGLLYGADAGGVINIYSGAASDQFSGNIQAELGRFDSRNVSANMGESFDKFDYYLAASDFKTEGFNALINDTGEDDDGYDNTTLHSRFGYQVSDKVKVGLVLRDSQGLSQFDNCGFGDTASNSCESEYNQTNLRTDLHYSADSSAHELAFTKTFIERDNFNQGQAEFSTKGTLERLEYIGNNQLTDKHQVVYGIDWEQEQITSAQQSRNSHGLYAEYQGEPVDNLYITAGIRHDDNEDFGQHNSVRISGAYIWTINQNEIKLRSAYGTGFRAPSLSEVEYNRGPFAYPPASDVELKEEQTEGYEIALEYRVQDGSHFQIVYFDQTIENSIEFDLAGFSGYLQDFGDSYSEGVELIGHIKLSDNLTLNTNYTYNDTEDSTGEQRVRRPRNIANVGFDYQLDKLTFSANVRFVQDFVDVVFDNNTFENVRVALDDYNVVDINARYQVNNNLAVFARVENLFDKQYQDLANFHTAGDTPYIGVTYQF